jgi:serine/threonine protein kinase
MPDEIWPQVKEIFEAAIQRTPEERPAFLDKACGANTGLRKSVESLLAHDSDDAEFLERSPMEMAQTVTTGDPGLKAGDELGVYRIDRRIDEGGMAVVYLATDPRFPRQVAIKVLPSDVTADRESVNRFKQEARAASALNHPGILTIYDVGISGSTHYIVTEFVDGENLRARVERSRMSVADSLDTVIAIASALKVTHAADIVHRDIKPENIMIRRDGLIKILDFGIAKLVSPSFEGTKASTIMRTRSGMVIGTPCYMSPEQWAGDAVDARTDIFSLGAVFYECLTGLVAFPNGVARRADLGSAPLPPPSQLNSSVPAELDRIVFKMLAVREARYGTANELLDELSEARSALMRRSGFKDLLGSISSRMRTSQFPAVVSSRYSIMAMVLLFALAVIGDRRPKPTAARENWYEKGVEALRNVSYQEASLDFKKAIDGGINVPLAHARLAETYLELDNKGKASDELYEFFKLVPDLSSLSRVDRLYVEALRAVEKAEYTRAIDRYRQIAELSPNQAFGYIDLGRVYEKDNKPSLALASYNEAASRDKDSGTAALREAVLYGQDHEQAKSDAAFQAAEKIYQAHKNIEGLANVHYQRALILLNDSNLPLALSESQQALEQAREALNEPLRLLAELQVSSNLYASGDPQKAEEMAKQALESASRQGMQEIRIGGLIDVGNAVFTKGDDLASAERYFDEALAAAIGQKDSRNENIARFSLGSVKQKRGTPDEALSDLEKAQAFFLAGNYHNYLAKTLLVLGRVRRDLGDYYRALKLFGELLDLSREDKKPALIALANGELGKVLLFLEDYSAAFAAFDESYLRSDKMTKIELGFFYMNRARTLWPVGRYAAAAADFDQARQLSIKYAGLAVAVDRFAAQMELSRGRLSEATRLINQFSSKATSIESKIEADRLRCLVRVNSNDSRGLSLCKSALESSAATHDPALLPEAQLSYATALAESHQWRAALEPALSAAPKFHDAKQLDSLWRASLIAALASRNLGQPADSQNYAGQARTALDGLKQKLGKQDTDGYLARPDISSAIRQLNGLVAKP